MRFLPWLAAIALALTIQATSAIAQVADASAVTPGEVYSRGAGAYFANRPAEAEKWLSTAIRLAPNDPRGYYLRGLQRMHQGDFPVARADLVEGARQEFEMERLQRGPGRVALQRSLAAVQGPSRLMLERIRREVRREQAVAQRLAQAVERKKIREQREQRLLRTQYHLPIESLVSQLTPEQAQRVAIKTHSPSLIAVAKAPAALLKDNASPFSDDVPEVARGKVRMGSLFNIFKKSVGIDKAVRAVGKGVQSAQGLGLPGMGGGSPGGVPAGMPGGDFGGDFEGDFGEEKAEPGDLDENPFDF